MKVEITGANVFTEPLEVPEYRGFDVLIGGNFVADVVIQVSSSNKGPWVDLETVNAPGLKTGKAATTLWFRAGVKAGSFTSGTVEVSVLT